MRPGARETLRALFVIRNLGSQFGNLRCIVGRGGSGYVALIAFFWVGIIRNTRLARSVLIRQQGPEFFAFGVREAVALVVLGEMVMVDLDQFVHAIAQRIDRLKNRSCPPSASPAIYNTTELPSSPSTTP